MSNVRDFLFGYPGDSSRWSDLGLALLRLYTGLAIALLHGMGKVLPAEGFIGMIGEAGFPAPALIAWFTMIAEFIGGLLLALGLMTRGAALLVVINMFNVAIVWHLITQGDAWGDFELPLLFFFVALVFLIRGAGSYSVDALIRKQSTMQHA